MKITALTSLWLLYVRVELPIYHNVKENVMNYSFKEKIHTLQRNATLNVAQLKRFTLHTTMQGKSKMYTF